MKIGIITFQKLYNFGACLQCYALWRYLTKQGHDVSIIDLLTRHHRGFAASKTVIRYRPPRKMFKSALRKIYSWILGFLCKLEFAPQIKRRHDNFRRFWALCKYTKCYHGYDELCMAPPCFDLYMTGSDQTWNPGLYYDLEAYFLNFAPKGSRKISYASSFGKDSFPVELSGYLKKWLVDYRFISVRERSGLKIIEENANLTASLVLDPTLLLDAEEWRSVSVTPAVGEPYILCIWYQSNKNISRYIDFSRKLQERSGRKVIIVTDASTFILKTGGLAFVQDAGPGELLGLIDNAEMVLSDSFHGAALSIVLAESFFVVLHKNALDDRKVSLFSILGLKDNIVSSLDDVDMDLLAQCPKIDRQCLNDRLSELRDDSIDFLKRALD